MDMDVYVLLMVVIFEKKEGVVIFVEIRQEYCNYDRCIILTMPFNRHSIRYIINFDKRFEIKKICMMY